MVAAYNTLIRSRLFTSSKPVIYRYICTKSQAITWSHSRSLSAMSQGNRLKYAKSPYLLQHAGNEVDWFEWSEEAFTKAKAEDKPVLLSVGYAACHWCHVFAHESFEDAGVARFMNENFISVKVDREERPDVDRVYMTYLQATNGRGGWPATYFLTPELTPIFAGTYFPKATFMSLMRQVTGMWKDEHKRKKMRASGQDVMEQLKDVSRSVSAFGKRSFFALANPTRIVVTKLVARS